MKAIIVDDEQIMLRSFMRLSKGISNLNVIAQFESPDEALQFAQENFVELAFLDIKMPSMNGIELAVKLREICPSILIVFISAYDEYIRDSNLIGGDYYIVKPYKRETIVMMMQKMQMLSKGLHKEIYVQMFGRFNVLKNGVPIALRGKAKEILALIASRCGKEISNEEIYSVIWEGREYSNVKMKVYYNALRRLKETLEAEGISDLLLSTPRGQMMNTEIVECDYYAWKNNKVQEKHKFEGEFLSEYSWGEYILAKLLDVE
ncbi:response regulator [Faecalimonas sp.]